MMPEISLNILDIAQNSVSAKALLIEISVTAAFSDDILTVLIKDNGCGMSEETLNKVTDPFYTSRKTRKVGLGIPFFKQAAESTGGHFRIESQVGEGTEIEAKFIISSIDRMPLGDMTGTIHTLITMNTDIDFIYTYSVDDRGFKLDTREFKEIVGDISLNSPEISQYIREYLNENTIEVNNGTII